MYHFIINPNAGGGKCLRTWRRVEEQLKKKGVEYEEYMTKRRGDARLHARKFAGNEEGSACVVVMGGDGTVNEVADGLAIRENITLGYIPTGSGNDLARSLGLSGDPVKGLDTVLQARDIRSIDCGTVSCRSGPVHRRFMVSAGIGMDAAVCHDILAVRKQHGKKGGRWRYLAAGIRRLILAKPVKGYVILDGVKKIESDHIYFVSVHIHPYEGGGFLFAPGADPCDGMLTVRIVSQRSKRQLIPILLGALFGRESKGRGAGLYSCREVRIHTERPMPVHCDGESCMDQQDIQARCVPGRVRMIL